MPVRTGKKSFGEETGEFKKPLEEETGESDMTESTVTNEKIGYRQVLTQKEYCKIIFANVISRFGDSIDAIAFTWLVYDATKSASWAAIISACNMLPTILLQPFAGAAVERRNKKMVMIASDIIRGLVVVALAFCYLTNQIYPWVLLAFTLLISSVEAFCMPASTAVIPKILDEKYYEYGMSLNSVGSTVMQLVGTGAAGVIIGLFGVHIAILIDAVTFFGAALVKAFLKVKEDVTDSAGERVGDAAKEYLTLLKEGLVYLKGKRVLMNLIMLAFFVNAMLVPINSFLAPLVSDVLGQGSELLSVIGMAMSVGSLLGSMLYPMISKKVPVKTFVFVTGLVVSASVSLMAAGNLFSDRTLPVYVTAGGASLLVGMGAALLSAMLSVQFMKTVEESYLARAGALLGAGATAAMPIVSFLMSGIVKFVPVKELILASGGFCAIIFIVIRILNVQLSEDQQDFR